MRYHDQDLAMRLNLRTPSGKPCARTDLETNVDFIAEENSRNALSVLENLESNYLLRELKSTGHSGALYGYRDPHPIASLYGNHTFFELAL